MLVAKDALKTREGRRLYVDAGDDSPQKRILRRALRTLRRAVQVKCFSKQRGSVALWYTGYSIYETDEDAYDNSFQRSINSWWPYDDKATALDTFEKMHAGKGQA